MRIAHPLKRAFTAKAHPAGNEPNFLSHLTELVWYMGVMLFGASVGTCGALVYSLVL